MPRNNQRNRNNNPEGRNQYSGGVMDMARERPMAAAATAAAAVGAGVFLWSRRNLISEQISHLSDQFSEWTQNMNSGSSGQFETDDTAGLTTGSTNRRGMSETGGGNASLGARSGGGGSTGNASGRSRARQTPAG